MEDFDYALPPDLIAQHPTAQRDESQLLVLDRATGRLAHGQFRDLVDYLDPGDLLVLNDTKVIPARLVGRRRTGGRVELLLLAPEGTHAQTSLGVAPEEKRSGKEEGCHGQTRLAVSAARGSVWRAMLKCRGRLAEGEALALEGGALTGIYRGREADGRARIEFASDAAEVVAALERVGRAPLPPYIKRPPEEDPSAAQDRDRYQTVYAAVPGAIAAPTAGLHFTPEVFAALDAKGIRRTTVTLHVGLGTFKPVTAERVEDHAMHEERFELPPEAAEAIAETRRTGHRAVAVGTTSARVLETAGRQPQWGPMAGSTDLFITPGFEFRIVDALVTNFHLPRSTLLMLVAAFAGRERILAAYQEAIRLHYRFYSYGDAMLIL